MDLVLFYWLGSVNGLVVTQTKVKVLDLSISMLWWLQLGYLLPKHWSTNDILCNVVNMFVSGTHVATTCKVNITLGSVWSHFFTNIGSIYPYRTRVVCAIFAHLVNACDVSYCTYILHICP